MKTKNVVTFFKTKTALANALGIKKQSINDWSDVVPFHRQMQLQEITGGKLKAMTWAQFLNSKTT